ncbi:hypothetical protein J6590_049949 [Homalodisca vitripennis]|nr:hypothetical protein J6590_049949 [Homalodisca vitripennis]
MEHSNQPLKLLSYSKVVSASLETILSRLNLNKPESQKVAVYMNHALVGCIMLTLVVNVVKMSFGLDPAA